MSYSTEGAVFAVNATMLSSIFLIVKRKGLNPMMQSNRKLVQDVGHERIVGYDAQGHQIIYENSIGNPMQTGDNVADKYRVEIDNHDEMCRILRLFCRLI